MDAKERKRLKDRIRQLHGPDFPVVEEIDGQIVLDDPAAVAMIQAVEAHNQEVREKNINTTFQLNAERIAHFRRRITERGSSPQEFVIVVLNVDDPNGGQLAEILMPGHDWQPMRDQGQIPFARGLAERRGLQEIVSALDPSQGEKMKRIDGAVVVVMDQGLVRVDSAEGF